MDKYEMRVPFSDSHYQISDEDDDDDHSCDFNFHPYQSLGPSTLNDIGLISHIDSVKFTHGKSQTLNDGALISEIERNMRQLSDNLLHGIEGISTRLLQLESRTQKIENSVDDLKFSAGYNYGRTDGKLRNLEDILLEVKDGVHFLREKQEIAETKIQLAKLRASSKSSSQSKDQTSAPQTDSVQQAPPYAMQQPHSPLSLSLPATFPLTVSSTSQYQNLPPVGSTVSAQLPSPSLPHSQISPQLPLSFYSPKGQSPEIPAHQNRYWQPPPHQLYPPHPEQTTPYFPAYSYPPSRFSRSPKPDEYIPGSAYASSSIEPSHYSQVPSVTGGETKCSQLAEAQILPRALPVHTEGSGNNRVVPMDDVVEMVTSMGFRRDLVKATARKLAENGQSVDLNVVLDKLMNSGAA